MYNVAQVQSQLRSARFDIPDLDGIIAGGRSQDVFGGGVEKNVAYLPVMASECVRETRPLKWYKSSLTSDDQKACQRVQHLGSHRDQDQGEE